MNRANVRCTAAVIAVALAGVALSGCVAATPSPTHTAAPTSTPTRTAAPLADPAPRIETDCTALSTGAPYQDFVAEPLQPQSFAVITGGSLIPVQYAVMQLEGVACDWTAGPAEPSDDLQPRVGIILLPDAEAEWEKLVTVQNVPKAGDASCNAAGKVMTCGAEYLLPNGIWMHVASYGSAKPGGSAAFTSWIGRLRQSLATTKVHGSRWTPPLGALPDNAPCNGTLNYPAIQRALGVAQPIVNTGPDGGWSIEASALTRLGSFGCDLSSGTSGQGSFQDGVGDVAWLPGGAWAWKHLDWSAASKTAIPGLQPGDGAWTFCTRDVGSCTTDLLLKNNWFAIVGYRSPTSATTVPLQVDARKSSIAIATAVVQSFGH